MATSSPPAAPRQGVPFFDQRASFAAEWDATRGRIEAVMDRGKYSHGAAVAELEQAIRAYTGATHAIGVNNGTDALRLLFRAAGIGPGDEVILPCFTWISPASMIAQLGAKPVFVDIEPGSYTLDVAAAAAAMTDRTRAIVPVHLFSQMAEMDGVFALARDSGVAVIEDSAEAMGMWWNGTHAGLLGGGGVISFFPTKTLGTLGDAGMVITEDPVIADRCRVLRHHGRMGPTIARISGISNAAGVSGTNSKMDEILAAILLGRLPRLTQAIARRSALHRMYDERLADLMDVVQTPRTSPRAAATNPVWYVYLIEAERRDELARWLRERGVQTEIYYPRPLHLQPCFEYLGGRSGEHPVAEGVCTRALGLPFFPDMSAEQVDIVGTAIEEFYR